MKKYKKLKLFLTGLVLVLWPVSCTFPSSGRTDTPTRPSETHAVDMRHEDIEKIYDVKKAWIDNAEESIDIEMWNMWKYDYGIMGELYKSLKQAARRGVRVRIALGAGNKNNEHIDEEFFDSPNISVVNVKPSAHSKYMVVDQKKVTVGSGNWSWSAMEQNYEFNLNIEDEVIGETFTYLFETLWEASGQNIEPGGGYRKTETIIPLAHGRYVPEDFKSIHEYQIEKINGAKDKILVSIYHFRPFFNEIKEKIRDRLAAAAERDVKIKLLVDESSYTRTDKDRIDDFASLENTYVKIIDMSQAPYVDERGANHTKIFLVDEKFGVISSLNWDRYTFDNSGRDAGAGFKDSKLQNVVEESFYLTWNSPYSKWAEDQFPVPETDMRRPKISGVTVDNITSTSAEFKSELKVKNAGVYFLWQQVPVLKRWEYHYPIFRRSKPGGFSYKVKNLKPDTRYGVVGQAVNKAGRVRTPVKYFKTESSRD
ncbi:MAG: phospholipase D-like domain-containing protein [Elusimicrobiota bacterium]